MRPILIAPSLLAADFTRMGEEIRRVEDGGADWLHVDVMDGHFVPNLSMGLPVVSSFKKVARKPLDVHIMIDNPDEFALRYVEAGADSLTFHLEAAEDPRALIQEIKRGGARVGMAVSPPTDVEGLRPFVDDLDLVLVMTVHPGFGGQKFMPGMMSKVETLRSWGYQGDIQVDGGIALDTIGVAAEAGATVFVAGTAVFRGSGVSKTIREMRDAAMRRAEA